MFDIDITHCNGGTECRTKATAAHFAYHFVSSVDYLCPFANWRPLLWQQTHPLACHPRLLLGKHHRGTGEAACTGTIGAAHLRDGPEQAGFDRCGGGIHIVAIQAQARFQAQ